MLSRIRSLWHFVKYFPDYLWAVVRFSGYKPQFVTIQNAARWLGQFDEKDRRIILQLLHRVIYISEKETELILLEQNTSLIERLKAQGIPPQKIIYIQVHDPGSSSAVMLNMLRDRGGLERKGYHFIDSKNVRELNELTERLKSGAIIYVDDFAGSGHQFCPVRDFLADYIMGNFSEFFLLPSICEEAMIEVGKRGVEPIVGLIHAKADRPLHPNCWKFDRKSKDRLVEICTTIDKKGPLGYGGLATMVVFYRNAPNSVPVILRGCVKQKPWVGILPRTTDLP